MSSHLELSSTTHPAILKQINTARLLELLRCHAPIARAELARLTGLTRSTVTVITADLIAQGLVQERGEIPTRGSGRPGVVKGDRLLLNFINPTGHVWSVCKQTLSLVLLNTSGINVIRTSKCRELKVPYFKGITRSLNDRVAIALF